MSTFYTLKTCFLREIRTTVREWACWDSCAKIYFVVAFESHEKGIEYLDAVTNDKAISSQLSKKEIKSIFTPENHLGASESIISNVSKSVQKTCKKFI